MFEGNINLLSSYDSTDKVNASSIKSRKLTTGILKSQESKDYSLRLWEDYNTTLEDLNNEIKSFKSKIIVVGKPINYTGDTVFDLIILVLSKPLSFQFLEHIKWNYWERRAVVLHLYQVMKGATLLRKKVLKII